jgi:hypothetical protein
MCRESAVQSATLDAIEYEYGVPVREYTTREELEVLIYAFIQSVARLEFDGEVSPVSDEREHSDTERRVRNCCDRCLQSGIVVADERFCPSNAVASRSCI